MSLTDIMSASGLVRYAEVALVLFFVAFLIVLGRTFAPGRRGEMERASRLPLTDQDGETPRPGADS